MWKTGPITALLIIACLLLRAQGYAQITISQKNTSLKHVITEIEKQTDYNFFYNKLLLRQANKVTIDVHDASLQQVLDHCFKNQPLQYFIAAKTISLSPKPVIKESDSTQASVVYLTGRVVNDNDDPVSGATITVKRNNKSIATATNDKGEFGLPDTYIGDTIIITSIGYERQEVLIEGHGRLIVRLKNQVNELSDVSVVHSGYQVQSKLRSTGSYAIVDQKLINRSVAANLIDKLEGVTSGLILNKNIIPGVNQSELSIRGRSTIFANPEPLIVLDNFPYNGTLSSINPQDVESVTVLKDAASAAIWGAFAGNGVMVITTKKGKYDQPLKISVNTNVTIGNKRDLYYSPFISATDQVDLEQYLFDKSFYSLSEMNPNHPVLPPVVELLIKKRDGLLLANEADAQIQALRSMDVRRDLEKYLVRESISQQYGVNINGGGTANHYSFSAGYDKNSLDVIGSQKSRFTLNANNTYALLKKKLELSAGIMFSTSNVQTNNTLARILSPYLKLADESGNALAVPIGLRQAYKDTAGAGTLLDWNYRPLDEAHLEYNTLKITDYRINTLLKYKIIPGLDASIAYQYNKTIDEDKTYNSPESYYTRDLINKFTQVSSTGVVTRPVPLGGILDLVTKTQQGHNIRGQLTYDQNWQQEHYLAVIAGAELRSTKAEIRANRLYGFNEERQTSTLVDYQTTFPMYYNAAGQAKVPFPYANANKNTTANFISAYLNTAYTWKRYTISASARKEESNIFGVKTNQKGVPLWSVGAAWQVSEEKFYKASWLPFLKLRISNGYSGNVDHSISAFTTGSISGRNSYNATTASIDNPPNPSLRWEKVHMINIGLDFATHNDRIAGSLEYYTRKARDLIGYSPMDPTTGNSIFKGNTGTMSGKGVDLTLNTKNINKKFQWGSMVLFSYAFDKVTDYQEKQNLIGYYYNATLLNPLLGNPLYSVYSLKWMGLDPQTGDPLGYKDGHPSKEYSALLNSSNFTDLQYNGPANPVFFGSLLNTFTWKQLELSFNITWKAGYYFRRTSVHYNDLFYGIAAGHSDIALRWQKPGDEKITNVPSLKYPPEFSRDQFYTYADVLVEKGDHIRLQDIGLNYSLTRQQVKKLPMQSLRVYMYLNNIGLLWKANDHGIDPDFVSSAPNPRSLSVGMKIDF